MYFCESISKVPKLYSLNPERIYALGSLCQGHIHFQRFTSDIYSNGYYTILECITHQPKEIVESDLQCHLSYAFDINGLACSFQFRFNDCLSNGKPLNIMEYFNQQFPCELLFVTNNVRKDNTFRNQDT